MVLAGRKIYFRIESQRTVKLEDYYQKILNPLLLEDPPDLAFDGKDFERWKAFITFDLAALKKKISKTGFLSRHHHFDVVRKILFQLSTIMSGETRERITYLFDELGFVRREMATLSDERWWLRARACHNLGVMKATEAMIPLVMLFDDEEEDVRVEAVQALIETAGVVGALLPILKNVRYLSTWMSLRLSKEVISAGSVAVPSLLEGLDSQYETIRKFALWMLGELKDHTAVTELLKRLDLYGVDEKALTLLALGKIGDERALDAVVRYTHYPLEQIRIAASSAIGSLGAPTLIPLLEQIILTDWLPVKIAAATALGRLEDEGRQRLQQLLTNEQSLVRSLAEQVLDELEYSRKV